MSKPQSTPIPSADPFVVETYSVAHLTPGELVELRKLMGLSDSWTGPVVRIPRGSPKFYELQAFLVTAGVGAAFRRRGA